MTRTCPADGVTCVMVRCTRECQLPNYSFYKGPSCRAPKNSCVDMQDCYKSKGCQYEPDESTYKEDQTMKQPMDERTATALLIGVVALVMAILSLALWAIYTPARADEEDEPLFACKRAIFAELRDPDDAKALYAERVVQHMPKGWIVILPVRATNGFGAITKQTFVCGYRDGRVVAVR